MCAGKFLRASPPRRGIHPRGEGFTPAAREIPEESPDGRNLAPVNRWIANTAWIFLLVVIVGGFLISRRLHDSFQHRVEEFTTAQAAATRHE